jgi:hypothetical protein
MVPPVSTCGELYKTAFSLTHGLLSFISLSDFAHDLQLFFGGEQQDVVRIGRKGGFLQIILIKLNYLLQ